MSKFYCTTEQVFDSSHLDPVHGPYLHGHTFHVKATKQGTDGGVPDDLPADLHDILHELDLHPLGEMLTGGSQTLEGIVAWIMERLLSRHPKLTSVEVWIADNFRVGIEREIR